MPTTMPRPFEATAADRAYCRRVLPRVSRTFALTLRTLSGPMREAASNAYLLCRAADALEDSWPGTAAEIGGRFDLYLAALEGDVDAANALALAARSADTVDEGAEGVAAIELQLVSRLPAVLATHFALREDLRTIVADGVRVLASGMKRYATRAASRPAALPYVDDEAGLHDYCYVVAGCVGEMLTRLFGAITGRGADREHAQRLALAPIVGEALQLTNILLDWPVDVRRGRCYVPASWLNETGATPESLVADTATARVLGERLEALARAALKCVPEYLDMIPRRYLRYRLFCLVPALWASASLQHARRDPQFPWGPRRPRLPRPELRDLMLRALLAAPSTAATDRLYARCLATG